MQDPGARQASQPRPLHHHEGLSDGAELCMSPSQLSGLGHVVFHLRVSTFPFVKCARGEVTRSLVLRGNSYFYANSTKVFPQSQSLQGPSLGLSHSPCFP